MHEIESESKVGTKLIRAKCHYSAVISVQTDRRLEYSSSCGVAPVRRTLPAVAGFRCRCGRCGQRACPSIAEAGRGGGGSATARGSWPRVPPPSRPRAAWATLTAANVRPDFSLYDTKRILTYQKVDGTSKRRRWQHRPAYILEWPKKTHVARNLLTTSDVTVLSYPHVSYRRRLWLRFVISVTVKVKRDQLSSEMHWSTLLNYCSLSVCLPCNNSECPAEVCSTARTYR